MTRKERIETKSRPWHEGLQAQIAADPEFRDLMVKGAFECLREGDADSALIMLHDVAKGTLGFPALAKKTGLHEKSLYRALSARGNPSIRAVSKVCAALAEA